VTIRAPASVTALPLLGWTQETVEGSGQTADVGRVAEEVAVVTQAVVEIIGYTATWGHTGAQVEETESRDVAGREDRVRRSTAVVAASEKTPEEQSVWKTG
jgi:hypothetical protein